MTPPDLPATLPDPIATLPPRTGPGRGKHSMPSRARAGRISVYTTPDGGAWLRATAAAAGCASIGQWADLMALRHGIPDTPALPLHLPSDPRPPHTPPRPRGRPPGSKNRPKLPTPSVTPT